MASAERGFRWAFALLWTKVRACRACGAARAARAARARCVEGGGGHAGGAGGRKGATGRGENDLQDGRRLLRVRVYSGADARGDTG